MEWRKVKNIVILILLLVNGFLLVFVGTRVSEVRRYERSAMEQAVQVLERQGIRVTPETLEPAAALNARSADRNTAVEETLAAALLGEPVEAENRGGGLYTYRGSRGAVSFRAGGIVSAMLNDDDRWHSQEPEIAVRNLLSDMGLNMEILADKTVEGTGTVTVCQVWQEIPVFSCQMIFSYAGGRLTALSGTLLAVEESVEEESEHLSMPTALMRFLDEIRASGDVCSEVLSMRAGYRVSQSFTSAVHLDPVWLISSNTADYYMDAVTGVVNRITE